jgi:hypothetical protein
VPTIPSNCLSSYQWCPHLPFHNTYLAFRK